MLMPSSADRGLRLFLRFGSGNGAERARRPEP